VSRSLDIYFVNESTHLSDTEAYNIAWGCNYQAQFQFKPHWFIDARCIYIPGGPQGVTRIPVGAAIMHFLDNSDAPGALGYHDEAGNEVPYGRVFVETILSDNERVSEVASHETVELAADPHINLSALTGDGSRLYAYELGDPCQGNGYDVGEPEGRPTGIYVADFILPAWADPNTPASQVTDYRGALRGPFALGPQGYFSFIETANFGQGWQQAVGSERTGPVPPDKDDRVGRRS
jgi:hypothetical protein